VALFIAEAHRRRQALPAHRTRPRARFSGSGSDPASVVKVWLGRCQEVLAFCHAPPNDGGDGALWVLLKAGGKIRPPALGAAG
jgi:DNA-nicking Smr family endonuclease